MATVGERIADLERRITNLEQVIAGYEVDLRNAVSREEMSEIRGLIRISRETLNRLLDEVASLRSSTSGKSLGSTSPSKVLSSSPSVACGS